MPEWFRAFADDLRKNIDARKPEIADAPPLDMPGGAPTDRSASNLPLPLHALVGSMRSDVEGEIRRQLAAGKAVVTLGLGPDVDVPLLRDDILAARVRPVERSVLIAMVRYGERGYAIGRDASNFGVFFRTEGSDGDWYAVPRHAYLVGLRPGDVVGLGSCPADAVTFKLPSPPGHVGAAGEDWRCEARLRLAVAHWRYVDITIGGTERAVVRLEDPLHARVAVMLSRNLDDPRSGFRLRVLHPGPGIGHAPPGGDFTALVAGDQRLLTAGGHRLRIGDLLLPVPAPVAPTARFSRNSVPTTADLLDVFGVGPHDLDDVDIVRARYRDLARRFHPDRNGGSAGHTSRFIEVQACWQEWQKTHREG